MPLKLLTLNIWNYYGPWPERRTLIEQWIARLDPDIIALQEVLRGPTIDQLAEINKPLGYTAAYAEAIKFWDDQSLSFGNALLSRWPQRDPRVTQLPDNSDGERRVALTVTVEAPVGLVLVTSTHFNWKRHHGFVRERQAVALCDMVLAARIPDGFPPVMMGDFNADPVADEMRYITGHHSINGRSVHFSDAWVFAGQGNGATWSNRNPYARLSFEPDRRIDYIFVGDPMVNGAGRIEHCRVVCDEEAAGVWPSDHLGVYAELATEPYAD